MLKYIYTIFLFVLSFTIGAQNENFNSLKVGDKAPVFSKLDQHKDTVDLDSLLQKGKVVILFYRGAWCPHCNRYMSYFQDSLSMITKKGVRVIAITPEVDSSIKISIAKTKVQFSIIHDSAYTIMNKYGVSFKVKNKTILKYKLGGINVGKANGNKDNILPVPATFIINKDGTINYIHFDENYKKRLSISEILKHI